MENREAMDRLSSAYRVEVDEDAKTRHLAEMGVALRSAPPTPVPVGFTVRRRLAGALAAVFVVAAPVGMAVAAEDAVPGDVLYPMKQATERVRAVFDDEVEATHRVEEVERLVFLRAPRAAITRAVERAEIATSELTNRGTLGSRLESARRHLEEQDEVEQREREATESRSREQDQGEADRRSEEERRQGSDSGAGREGASDESSSNSLTGSQQSGRSGDSPTTTTPAEPGGSGGGAGEPQGGSSVAPETERIRTPNDSGSGLGNAGAPSTTVP